LTASGAVESGYTAVALTNGVGSSSVYLASTGDIIQVVDNPTTPTITADSSPVTITDPTLTPPSTVTIGSGPDTLALEVSEDAWKGNAQFTVSVDNQQIGGTQTATALNSLGQTQIFDVQGTFAAGSHTATVDFLNDAYGGTPATDRNLYVVGASIDGSTVPVAMLSEYSQGPQSFGFLAPGSAGSGSPVDSVIVNQPADLTAAV
jgi:Ca-dependent carbohydrate-binding module xylan-binding